MDPTHDHDLAHAGNQRHGGTLLVVFGVHALLLWAALQPGGRAPDELRARTPAPGVLMLWHTQPTPPVGLAQAAAPAPRAAPALGAASRQRNSQQGMSPANVVGVMPIAASAVETAAAGPATPPAMVSASMSLAAPPPAPSPAPSLSSPAAPPSTLPSAPQDDTGPAGTVHARADHRHCPGAPYPAVLQQRGIEGAALVRVRVDSEGRAAEVRLVAGSGWRLFDDAAVQRARGCRFFPAQRGGAAVESWVEFPVRFALAG
jgi:periplasmic protein TonB